VAKAEIARAIGERTPVNPTALLLALAEHFNYDLDQLETALEELERGRWD